MHTLFEDNPRRKFFSSYSNVYLFFFLIFKQTRISSGFLTDIPTSLHACSFRVHFEIITGIKQPAWHHHEIPCRLPAFVSPTQYVLESLVCKETSGNIIAKCQLGNTQWEFVVAYYYVGLRSTYLFGMAA